MPMHWPQRGGTYTSTEFPAQQSPVGQTSSDAPTSKMSMAAHLERMGMKDDNYTHPADNRAKWKTWAGGPVKQQNRAMKNDFVGDLGRRNPTQFTQTGIVKNYPPMEAGRNVIDQQVTNPTKYRFKWPGGMAGPVGKLPLVGALPMPSTMLGAAEDSSANMGWRERMARFLARTAGMNPDDNPISGTRADLLPPDHPYTMR